MRSLQRFYSQPSTTWFRPNGFWPKYIACLALSLTLIVGGSRYHAQVPQVRCYLAPFLSYAYRFAGQPRKQWSALKNWSQSKGDLLNATRKLQLELYKAKQACLKVDYLTAENEKLRALLQATAQPKLIHRLARSLQLTSNPYRREIIIEHAFLPPRGTQAYAVINELGVVGKVIGIYGTTSRVQLLSDPNHAIPAEINRTKLRCLVSGTSDAEHLQIAALPSSSEVEVGDLVVSSGIGGVFPAGVPIGTIEYIHVDPKYAWKRALVKPAVHFNQLDYLSLVSICDES